MFKIIFSLLLLASYICPVHAADIIVPDHYSTIQSAINAAVSGVDTVIVKPGTYVENISFNGKAITVKSEQGPLVTIIDGNQADSVVKFNNNETYASVIDGFTIQNGKAFLQGGGIFCYWCQCIIRNNIIRYNQAGQNGGGIFSDHCNPYIVNTIIHHNHAVSGITYGGGIDVRTNTSNLTNCTIYGNSATYGGGVNVSPLGTLRMANSIVWGNSSSSGNQIEGGGGVYVTYSNIQNGYPGTGNINANPAFKDGTNGDFHLQGTSPCIDVGNNSASLIPSLDFEGDPRIVDGDNDNIDTVDMGADEYLEPTVVTLTSFIAYGDHSKVIIQWETSCEIDTAGFHIWRSHKGKRHRRVSDQMIPATGGPTWAAIYRFLDRKATPGIIYTYRLEDISYCGASTFHPPVQMRWAPR